MQNKIFNVLFLCTGNSVGNGRFHAFSAGSMPTGTAHWGVFDPAAVEEEQKNMAFAQAFAILHRRIALFAALNPANLEQLALEKRVREIGLES